MSNKEDEGSVCCCFILIISIILVFYIFPSEVVVNIDNILDKTEDIFTGLHYENLPAYSKFIKNRAAAAKLVNMMSFNNAGDTHRKNAYYNLILLLDEISKDLGLIYEKGNKFFINSEKTITEWKKHEKHPSTLFESMRDDSIEFSDTLSKANVTIHLLEQLDLSILLCDTSSTNECEHELSRVKEIIAFVKNCNKVELFYIPHRLRIYSNDLNNIIKDLSKRKVKVISTDQTTKLKSLINRIKSSHMGFLMNQDVASKLSSPNDHSFDITENVGSKVHKSDLVGEAGCRGEFMTYFAARTTKYSPLIRSIKISADEYIDSLTFEWSDNMSLKFGGDGGKLINFDLEKGEEVSLINIHKYIGGKICGLEFRTNKWRSTGILGKSSNLHPTTLEVPRGHKIVGLYGGFDKYICGIGILYSKVMAD